MPLRNSRSSKEKKKTKKKKKHVVAGSWTVYPIVAKIVPVIQTAGVRTAMYISPRISSNEVFHPLVSVCSLLHLIHDIGFHW